MIRIEIGRWRFICVGLLLASMLWMSGMKSAGAQPPIPGAASDNSPPNARKQAPYDPAGNWVSLVTRDWRFRMLVPPKGDFAGVPVSPVGKGFATAWDASADASAGKQCEAYGAGAVMLIPERLQIAWQDDNTLRVQTDAGMQTRLLHFVADAKAAEAGPSWQGYSLARWQIAQPRANNPFSTYQVHEQAVRAGSIKVSTTHLLAGLIRKNGVAYSDQAQMTEYWEQHAGPPGDYASYLLITSVLSDPLYLLGDYRTMAIFEREPDNSKWDPTPCTLSSAP